MTKLKNKQTNKISILGIGNTLYSDEGVAIHVLPLLENALAGFENVEIIEGATDGMRLLGPVEEADYLLIIDAINAGEAGGTLITISNDDIPQYFGVKMSIHQVGFQEVLFASKIRDKLPNEMVMIGVQPESLVLGVELSDPVRAVLPDLVIAVVEQVKKWSN
ncbi:HyaD/HybD family hydrogenase maturation endopeptidase [Schinkia azotoformans]|uniref:HyaD/HybD family hydrogenase maturation endopeptidase n=1 Tax=Schinkia azotoformans TaxID=1454 RepID=UPI002DB637D5|nr:HyaD/HybD family hydrogenase maturation endopeptidase [Schinkia azotoformans]MEC1697555.1 HyaD/HybD family hydrogenase maturation endopeptidase [Schinkia azotoformans]MEC1727377.1 HyaD/HybD family hydrogenase maturation endopeptidase [Schinkia azotoformans]MEC1772767.1 HyaD/HybD family hydrogenase maturation endopeptidase [Schinkia azotoformans]MEC1781378.1 HyaD/HybD family hydrogenase maturation endopeptidase [Schinkia azotoformans]MED4331321.1 HyaD/HybD family hydrogenase maturation endop